MSILTPDLVRHIVTAALTAYPDPSERLAGDPPIIALAPVGAAALAVRFDDETVAVLTITVAEAVQRGESLACQRPADCHYPYCNRAGACVAES